MTVAESLLLVKPYRSPQYRESTASTSLHQPVSTSKVAPPLSGAA